MFFVFMQCVQCVQTIQLLCQHVCPDFRRSQKDLKPKVTDGAAEVDQPIVVPKVTDGAAEVDQPIVKPKDQVVFPGTNNKLKHCK